MKQKLIITAALLISAFTTFSQNRTSYGLSLGYDQNMFYDQNLSGSVSNEIPDFNIEGHINYHFGEKMILRTELRYSNLSFQKDYTLGADTDDLDITKLASNNIGFTPHFDYKLFSVGKLDMYSSLGLRFEFTFDDFYRSYTNNGDKMNADYFNTYFEEHTKTMFGATVGLLLKMNLGENTSLTLSPEYASYFSSYYVENKMALQRISANIGLEWRF